MKKLLMGLMAVILTTGLFAADAANDLLLSQRNPGNTGNIQKNVPGQNAITTGSLPSFQEAIGLGATDTPQFTGLTLSGLTNTRVVLAGASGVLGGDADLTFLTDTLSATKIRTGNNTLGLGLADTDLSNFLLVAAGSNLTSNRTLTITTGDADRTLTMTGNATVNQDVSTAGSPTFVTLATSSGSAGAVVGLTMLNSGVPVAGKISVNGSGVGGTAFGVNQASAMTIVSNSGGQNPTAMLIGNLANVPLVFGINDAEVGRFTSTSFSTVGVNVFGNVTDSSSTTTGSVQIAGGIGIAKKLFTGDSASVTTSLLTPSTTFALLNATATTINAFGAAATVNTGAAATQIWNFGGSTTASEFRFLEPSGSGTNYSAFKAVAQGANITYSLPPTVSAAGGSLTDVAGNGVLTWVVGGSGTIISGTTNRLPKYTAATTVGNSLASDDGTTLTYTGTGGVTASGPITAGGAGAGALVLPQGSTQTAGTTNITIQAPAAVTSYIRTLPGAVGSTGFLLETVSGSVQTESLVAASGTGNVMLSSLSTGQITVNIGDGTNVITTGEKVTARLSMPFSCTLTGWTILANTSTTTVIDVWKDTYANYPATNADSITNAHEPATSAAIKEVDTNISDWTSVAVTAGDQLGFNVDSNNNAAWVQLVITYTRP